MIANSSLFSVAALIALACLASCFWSADSALGQTIRGNPWEPIEDYLSKQSERNNPQENMGSLLNSPRSLTKQPEVKEALAMLKEYASAVGRRECSHGLGYQRRRLLKIVRNKYSRLEAIVLAYGKMMADSCGEHRVKSFSEQTKAIVHHYPIQSREFDSIRVLKDFFLRLIHARLLAKERERRANDDYRPTAGGANESLSELRYPVTDVRWTWNKRVLAQIFHYSILRSSSLDVDVAASIAYEQMERFTAEKEPRAAKLLPAAPAGAINAKQANKLYWAVLVDSCVVIMRLYGDVFDLAKEDAKLSPQNPYLGADSSALSPFYLSWAYYEGCAQIVTNAHISHALQKAVKEVAKAKVAGGAATTATKEDA